MNCSGCLSNAKVCRLFTTLLWVGLSGCSGESPSKPINAQPHAVTAKTAAANTKDQPEDFAPLKLDKGPVVRKPAPPQTGNSESKDDGAVMHLPSSERTRLPDDRSPIDAESLKAIGIKTYESDRLLLVSDLPAEDVQDLPRLADQLFRHLESHFGILPTSIDASEFQVTGYLISDRDRFTAAGLMPKPTFTIKHGRHDNYEFWMFDQQDDYYRRHLLLHEFTHCFMTCESGILNIPPLWYIEGMAEVFATHKPVPEEPNTFRFGVLPDQFEGFEGWGRISELRRHFETVAAESSAPVAQFRVTSLSGVMREIPDFFSTGKHYSGSWALCWFLHNHPRYAKQFEPLRKLRTRAEFNAAIDRLHNEVAQAMSVDWLLFQEVLNEGFDSRRSWPVHNSQRNSPEDTAIRIRADLGWQDTGVALKPKSTVTISCSGQFSVNDDPQPWISEPQGVSVEYYRGIPLGQVVAVLVGDDGKYLSARIPVGRKATFIAPQACRLWLQINDSSASRSNNAGEVAVLTTTK